MYYKDYPFKYVSKGFSRRSLFINQTSYTNKPSFSDIVYIWGVNIAFVLYTTVQNLWGRVQSSHPFTFETYTVGKRWSIDETFMLITF